MPRVKVSSTVDREHALTGEKLCLLAVFARPADEAFGPAGTLAKYASEGVRVSLVTAARETIPASALQTRRAAEKLTAPQREQSCSCLTSGTQRLCLIDHAAGGLDLSRADLMEERLVRLIREQRPQVVVTHGPVGLPGDPASILVSQVTTHAFHTASDSAHHPQHLRDGLTPHQPLKLYYNVLPQSIVERWGLHGLAGVPDDQITTMLDVSQYPEAKLKALYCQRDHALDYARWLAQDQRVEWDVEYFALAVSHLARKPRRENDLFAGLR